MEQLAEKPYLIDFIIPHHNDHKIINAINSIKKNSYSDLYRIIVMDTGSNLVLSKLIAESLRKRDLHIIEKDEGIFDALNKGLELASARWVGWLGADDLLSLNFNPSYISNIDPSYDIASYTTFFYSLRNKKILRVYRPVGSKLLRSMGAHLPHFSTYVRLKALKKIRFDIKKRNYADQIFFLELEKLSRVKIIRNVSTYMAAGGSSNESIHGIITTNKNVFNTIKQKTNMVNAFVYISIKLIYKIIQKFIPPSKEESEGLKRQMNEIN